MVKRLLSLRSRAASVRPGIALRRSLREGYGWTGFRRDLGAGLIVGIIALPLSMALAIASGVPPQHGLYTAIVAGTIVAMMGGSRLQVTGPTAAFVVILVPITAQYGLAGLLIATAMAGVMQMLMGLMGMGRLIQFIPYTVTTGFTSGIAVVIATMQIKDMLGLRIDEMPHHYLERVVALYDALPSFNWADIVVGVITLLLLIYWPRWFRRLPAPLVALTVAGVMAWLVDRLLPGVDLATIRGQFGTDTHPHGIPQLPPMPGWPWSFVAGGADELTLSLQLVRELSMAAFAIAILGAIESLLSAVVVDGMSNDTHDPDTELFAQGAGNVVGPFFGAFAATGAIARTSANFRFGARSPLAAVIHAGFIFGAVLAMAPMLGYLPMAGLAALLLRVAWNMSEARHFIKIVRIAPRGDVLILLVCFGLTVFIDMVVAVTVGVVLAALMFMRRMADVANVQLVSKGHEKLDQPLPENVMLYEIAGPMFFGAAHKAMSTIRVVDGGTQIVVLDMSHVPMMDVTGLVNLQSAIERLTDRHIYVIIAGAQTQPLHVMAKAGLRRDRKLVSVFGSFEEAMSTATMMSRLLTPDESPE